MPRLQTKHFPRAERRCCANPKLKPTKGARKTCAKGVRSGRLAGPSLSAAPCAGVLVPGTVAFLLRAALGGQGRVPVVPVCRTRLRLGEAEGRDARPESDRSRGDRTPPGPRHVAVTGESSDLRGE